jgi:hypothetical protein
MTTIPELLDGHITLEVGCLDRLYLNGYIGKLATGSGRVFFVRDQSGKPIPSPVVLGQISEKFREAVKVLAEQEGVPVYQFRQLNGVPTIDYHVGAIFLLDCLRELGGFSSNI